MKKPLDKKEIAALAIGGVVALVGVYYYMTTQRQQAQMASQAAAGGANPYGVYGYPYFQSAAVPGGYGTPNQVTTGGVAPIDMGSLTSGLSSALNSIQSSNNQLLSLLTQPAAASSPSTSSAPATPAYTPPSNPLVAQFPTSNLNILAGPSQYYAVPEFLTKTPNSPNTIDPSQLGNSSYDVAHGAVPLGATIPNGY